MTILSEIRDFLERQIKEHAGVDKGRNIELISQYYGFGDLEFPTLEEVAERFDSIGTRERVRQIISNNFRRVVTSEDIPSAQPFLDILVSRSQWFSSDLDEAVTEAGVAGDSFSLPGLLRLLDDLELQHAYDTYSTSLGKATRSTLHSDTDYLLLRKQSVPRLRALLQRARAFPGLKGIARFEDLESTHDDFTAHSNLMLEIIRRHPETWVRQREDGLWYLFEDRDNSLVNSGRKALTAFEECDLSRLAQSCHAALRRRSNRYARPTADLIEDYLRTSRHFAVDGSKVRRPPSFKPVRLNDIEEDLIEYLGTHKDVRFVAAKDFLEGKSYTEFNIVQALTMSPLVFVDRTLGRRNHIYYTPEPLDSGQPEEPSTENRYSKFRNRLDELRETDSTSEQSARREQHILSEWLFEGMDAEICALCGREFAVEALVTAHKKRRADCNEGERRDPYIVMPLCLFGCDYLYEKQHVYVAGGVVKRGIPLQTDGVEKDHVDELVDRPLEERWLEGLPDYFHRPADEGGQQLTSVGGGGQALALR